VIIVDLIAAMFFFFIANRLLLCISIFFITCITFLCQVKCMNTL